MAQRRPITTHPAFVPLLALWFTALLGLAVAVLPAPLLERGLAAIGLAGYTPLTPVGRVTASGAAALIGLLLGLALALPLARRARRDPRPIYAEEEFAAEPFAGEESVRRPLRVREELAEDLPSDTVPAEDAEHPSPPVTPRKAHETAISEAEEGFMILTPQPVHPPRPAPDLEGLLEQFDTALAAFRSGEDAAPAQPSGGADPVHAFVARQTGTPAPSPLGGRMPDHQAELRAALDKLARAHRKE